MNIVVLGGRGFIGSHLVSRLQARNHSIRVFDRGIGRPTGNVANVEYVTGDFLDIDTYGELFEGVEVVFHLISTTVPSTSNEDVVADVVENLVSTLHLLKCLVSKRVRKLIFLSSGGTVYGRARSLPINEASPTSPICSYGVVKLAIEHYLHMYQRLYGLDFAALRVSNPYGEGQGHFGVQGVIGTFIEKIRRSEPIEVWGDGTVERDFVYVGDVAEACEIAAYADGHGIFNIGSGVSRSVNEVISALETVTEKHIERVFLPGRAYDVPSTVLDCSKAAKELAWHAKTDFLDGLRKTWIWTSTEHRSPASEIGKAQTE